MVLHICNVCKYSSHSKFNYDRHCLTKKHQERVQTINDNVSNDFSENIYKSKPVSSIKSTIENENTSKTSIFPLCFICNL